MIERFVEMILTNDDKEIEKAIDLAHALKVLPLVIQELKDKHDVILEYRTN